MSVMTSPTRTTPVHVIQDPQPGQHVVVPAGARLAVRFRRRGLGLSRWQVVDRPGNLLPLEEGPHGFLFLVFDADATEDQPLRLIRRRVDRSGPGEVRDLTVRVS
ncbi:hypothetical protein GCM10009795_025610 [Nocardioides hankookensis]|jgi:hypothetical protein|uniref:Proteinase inhibitor I42 chagasin domain-containing protein n=1 Tax=Nocardioides hankookensis TaxID=443157 RepID=A0ABW1LCB0_9ACTN|nr:MULTISPECIES: hypothetical protein [unclassified Nocardioides]